MVALRAMPPPTSNRAPGRRPVVTGIGLITPLGVGLEETFQALRHDGATGVTAGATRTRLSRSTQQPAWRLAIPHFEPRPFFHTPKSVKLTDRKTQLAVAAAELAVRDAGISDDDSRDALAVVLGCSSSDVDTDGLGRAVARSAGDVTSDIPAFAEAILKGLNPLWLLVNLPNMVSAHVAIQQRSQGPNWTVMTDWIAGLQAIGEAAAGISTGELDWALAGGADCGTPVFFAACYGQDGALGENGRGLVLSEGAAILVLESEEHARARGARLRGSIEGFCCRASGAENGAATGLRGAMCGALADAGWCGADLDLVCRAAVDHRSFLDEERTLVAELFAASRRPPDTLELRSSLGHALGASGAIDAALALRFLGPRPGSGRALCNALGYEGQAAALAVATESTTSEERP